MRVATVAAGAEAIVRPRCLMGVTPHGFSLYFSWLLGSDWEISLFKEPSKIAVGINFVRLLLLPLVASTGDLA